MKIHEWNQMYKYLIRKKDKLSVNEKKKIIDDFYKKAEQPKSKPMDIVTYINKINKLYGNGDDPEKDPKYIDPREMEDIKKTLPVSEMVKKKDSGNPRYVWNIAKGVLEDTKTDEYGNPETATTRIQELDKKPKKKKQIKKVAEKPSKPSKPTYLNGNVIDITPLIDDQWWKILDYPLIQEEDPSEKTRRRYERLKQLEEERIAAKGLGNLLKLKKYRYES